MRSDGMDVECGGWRERWREMYVRTGARMNMPMKGIFESRSPSISNGASKDSTCTTYKPVLSSSSK